MNPIDTLLHQADLQFSRQEWAAARDSVRTALVHAPEHPGLWATLGNLHYLLREYAAARSAFEAAAKGSPDDCDLLIRLAIAHRELGEFAAEEVVLGRVCRMQPEEFFARFLLADCYRDLGQPERALALYRALLVQRPGHAGVLLALAKVLHARGDLPGARAALERVVVAEPDNRLAQENLAAITPLRSRMEPPAAATQQTCGGEDRLAARAAGASGPVDGTRRRPPLRGSSRRSTGRRGDGAAWHRTSDAAEDRG